MSFMWRVISAVVPIALSRVLGFVRDALFAKYFGVSAVADIFNFAFQFPNRFRALLGEGAFNTILTPSLIQQEAGLARDRFMNQVLSWLMLITCFLILVFELSAGLIVTYLAPGFKGVHYDLAVYLLRIMLPFLGFILLSAFATSVLNSHNRFFLSGFVGALLNVWFIGGLLIYHYYPAYDHVSTLAYSVVTGGALNMLILFVWLRVLSIRWRLQKLSLNADIKQFMRLFGSSFIASSALPITGFVTTALASYEAKGISALYYAERLYQLPVGLIIVAMGTVVLTQLSYSFKLNGFPATVGVKNNAFALLLLLLLPSVVSIIIMGDLSVKLIFERGAFTAQDTQLVTTLLWIYALSLVWVGLIRIQNNWFFVLQVATIPRNIALIASGVNLIISYSLFSYMGIKAIPLGFLVGNGVQFLALGYYAYKLGYRCSRHLVTMAGLIGVMNIILILLGYVAKQLLTLTKLAVGLKLLTLIVFMVIVYMSLIIALGLHRKIAYKKIDN